MKHRFGITIIILSSLLSFGGCDRSPQSGNEGNIDADSSSQVNLVLLNQARERISYLEKTMAEDSVSWIYDALLYVWKHPIPNSEGNCMPARMTKKTIMMSEIEDVASAFEVTTYLSGRQIKIIDEDLLEAKTHFQCEYIKVTYDFKKQTRVSALYSIPKAWDRDIAFLSPIKNLTESEAREMLIAWGIGEKYLW